MAATANDWHEAMLYEPRRGRGAVPRLPSPLSHRARQERHRAGRGSTATGRCTPSPTGSVCSVAADPIEKKPLYHFFPGTTVLSLGSMGCNFTCRHCQNWQIAHADPAEATRDLRELPIRNLPVLAEHNDCQGVAWTYNEPTIWLEYILDGAQARARARPLHGDGHQRLHHARRLSTSWRRTSTPTVSTSKASATISTRSCAASGTWRRSSPPRRAPSRVRLPRRDRDQRHPDAQRR